MLAHTMKPGMWVILTLLGCVVALLVWYSRFAAALDATATTKAPAAVVGLVPVGDPVEGKTAAGNRQLVGRVRNTDTQPRTGRVQVTMFDASGKATGTVDAYVQHVDAGGEATYDPIIGKDVPAWSRLEVRVVTQLRDPQR